MLVEYVLVIYILQSLYFLYHQTDNLVNFCEETQPEHLLLNATILPPPITFSPFPCFPFQSFTYLCDGYEQNAYIIGKSI